MTNFEHTAKGRAVLAQTEADNEGMFQYARQDEQVLDELLTQFDMSDELAFFFANLQLVDSDSYSEFEKCSKIFCELTINDVCLSDVIRHLVKSNEQYARRFYDELIEEYKGFCK